MEWTYPSQRRDCPLLSLDIPHRPLQKQQRERIQILRFQFYSDKFEQDLYLCPISHTGTNPPQESEVSLKISVHSTPFVEVEFSSARYVKSLAEDASTGSSVFTITASYSGSVEGTLTYSIVGGDFDNTFDIDSSNGKVTLAKSLDYETVKKHKLIIRATFDFSDGNVQDIAAEVTGEVTVQDVNDNSPRFLLYSSPTRIAIESYTPSVTEIIKVNWLKIIHASISTCTPALA